MATLLHPYPPAVGAAIDPMANAQIDALSANLRKRLHCSSADETNGRKRSKLDVPQHSDQKSVYVARFRRRLGDTHVSSPNTDFVGQSLLGLRLSPVLQTDSVATSLSRRRADWAASDEDERCKRHCVTPGVAESDGRPLWPMLPPVNTALRDLHIARITRPALLSASDRLRSQPSVVQAAKPLPTHNQFYTPPAPACGSWASASAEPCLPPAIPLEPVPAFFEPGVQSPALPASASPFWLANRTITPLPTSFDMMECDND